MTKEQCEAIIKTIETATIFLYENGIPSRNKSLTKILSQYADDTVIAADVAAFDADIQTIISSIPDDE